MSSSFWRLRAWDEGDGNEELMAAAARQRPSPGGKPFDCCASAAFPLRGRWREAPDEVTPFRYVRLSQQTDETLRGHLISQPSAASFPSRGSLLEAARQLPSHQGEAFWPSRGGVDAVFEAIIYGLKNVASQYHYIRNAAKDPGGSNLWPPGSVLYTQSRLAACPTC